MSKQLTIYHEIALFEKRQIDFLNKWIDQEKLSGQLDADHPKFKYMWPELIADAQEKANA